MTKPTFQLRSVTKVYGSGKTAVTAVDDLTLDILPGEPTLIMGPSGSGKTTLLSVCGALLRPSSGEVLIQGRDITMLSERELPTIRLKQIGFVFQEFNLFSNLTAEENIELVLNLAGKKGKVAKDKARELLETFGLLERGHHYPRELSWGQQQRIAIIRAIANDPPIILADEPTGNLDSFSGAQVMGVLSDIAYHDKRTVLIVSHDIRLKEAAARILYMEDGKIIREERNPHARRPVAQEERQIE